MPYGHGPVGRLYGHAEQPLGQLEQSVQHHWQIEIPRELLLGIVVLPLALPLGPERAVPWLERPLESFCGGERNQVRLLVHGNRLGCGGQVGDHLVDGRHGRSALLGEREVCVRREP